MRDSDPPCCYVPELEASGGPDGGHALSPLDGPSRVHYQEPGPFPVRVGNVLAAGRSVEAGGGRAAVRAKRRGVTREGG